MRPREEDIKWVRHLFWAAQELMRTLPRADKDSDEPDLLGGAVEEMAELLLDAPDWALVCPACGGAGLVEEEQVVSGQQTGIVDVHQCPMCEGRPS